MVDRSLLKEHAYDQLKRLIQVGEFPAGAFLSERVLAQRFGMSKTPIRSALERLASEGFLRISPQQGAVVLEPSLRETVDLFDVRIALEAWTVRRLAGRVGADQETALDRELGRQREALEASDLVRCTELDADFHLLMAELMGNHEVVRILTSIRDRLFRVVLSIFSRDPLRAAVSYQEHVGIVDAVRSGDGELAATRLTEHLEYAKRALVGVR